MPLPVFNPNPRSLINYQEVKDAWYKCEVTYKFITQHNACPPISPPLPDGRPSPSVPQPQPQTTEHTRRYHRLMHEMYSNVNKVYEKSIEVLVAHLEWLKQLQDEPESRDRRLAMILDACQRTEDLQENCRAELKMFEKNRSKFIRETQKAFDGEGKPLHEVCGAYDYKWGQRQADVVWKVLNTSTTLRPDSGVLHIEHRHRR